jgi:hypothetical protein
VKEFLQAITHFNLEIIKTIVQVVPIFITKNMVVEMFHLPDLGITKLLAKPTKERTRKEKRKGRWPSTEKMLHQKHLLTGKDGRFPFSKEGVQPDYRH